MNQGKDVFTLMKEIRLPSELKIAPYFGKLAWTIRGIFHEYAGWFDEDPASMYTVPISGVYSDIVELAGGEAKIVDRASAYLKEGSHIKVLHLTKIVLGTNPGHHEANRVRLEALKKLRASTYNYIERIWLDYGIRLCNDVLNGK
jgi:alkyl sulfatase BDS1-like metallo-beta-lactamase superfamily hydrolase